MAAILSGPQCVKNMILKLIIQNSRLSTHGEIPCNPINEMSSLFQVMAWCRQASGRYLSQS